jgi:uncharacterized protein YhbP (UPF0306 family)
MNIEPIIREYIDKSVHMSLATSTLDGRPWVCEVHFSYDDDLNLYWLSKSSRRHSLEIEANPNVAGNIVKQHEISEYPHAIYFEGKAVRVSNDNYFADICELFKNTGFDVEDMIKDAKNPEGHQFYKVKVENWYAFGKFGSDNAHKYQLAWNGGKK